MRAHRLLQVGYVGCAAASLWLRSAVPASAVYAPHDDFLFLRLAYYLGGGYWLGPFDNLTLAKGMAYSGFILTSFVAGVPLKIGEQAVYLASAGVAAWLVARLTGKRWLAFLLFACLAFNPILWASDLSRVIREGLYVSLSFLVLLLAAAVLLPRQEKSGWLGARIALPVALGLAGAVYWLTREEGIWLLPALAVLLGAAGTRAWRQWRSDDRQNALRELSRSFAAGAIAAFVFGAGVASVGGMNYLRYGVFTTGEFHSASFLSAYGSLTRIVHEKWQRFVLFPKDAREKAYAVSPAAQELRPTFEGKHGDTWRRIGCEGMRYDICPEILSGWFMWALRDAVAAAGHYSSAPRAFAFYDRLAAEINAACDDGRLKCRPAPFGILAPFRWHYVGDALALTPELYRLLVSFGDGSLGAPPSVGPPFILGLFTDLVGPVSRAPPPSIILRGLVERAAAPLHVFVRDSITMPYRAELTVEPENEEKQIPFELDTDCLRPTCELVVKAGSIERAFPISALVTGEGTSFAENSVVIQRVLMRLGASATGQASKMRRELQLRVAGMIATIYSTAARVLPALALIGILLAAGLRRFQTASAEVLALALACGVAAASRIELLAYLAVTTLPANNLHYLSPATPFLLTFVVLGLFLGGQSTVAAYRGRVRAASNLTP